MIILVALSSGRIVGSCRLFTRCGIGVGSTIDDGLFLFIRHQPYVFPINRWNDKAEDAEANSSARRMTGIDYLCTRPEKRFIVFDFVVIVKCLIHDIIRQTVGKKTGMPKSPIPELQHCRCLRLYHEHNFLHLP